MLNSFQTLMPGTDAPSLHAECDEPSISGFSFMKSEIPHWKDLSPQDLLNEIWKDTKEFPELYEVSNFTRIRRKKRTYYGGIGHGWRNQSPKILTQHIHKSGYVQAALIIDGKPICKKIHRLVANAFIPNPDNLPQVNHLDANKQNNYPYNLEWTSGKENTIHAKEAGLLIRSIESKAKMTGHKKTVIQKDLNGNFIAEWSCIKEGAKSCGMAYRSIYLALYGKTNKPKRFLWEFK